MHGCIMIAITLDRTIISWHGATSTKESVSYNQVMMADRATLPTGLKHGILKLSGDSVVTQWSLSGDSVVTQWPLSGDSVVTQW